jgi:hypothetical protein
MCHHHITHPHDVIYLLSGCPKYKRTNMRNSMFLMDEVKKKREREEKKKE